MTTKIRSFLCHFVKLLYKATGTSIQRIHTTVSALYRLSGRKQESCRSMHACISPWRRYSAYHSVSISIVRSIFQTGCHPNLSLILEQSSFRYPASCSPRLSFPSVHVGRYPVCFSHLSQKSSTSPPSSDSRIPQDPHYSFPHILHFHTAWLPGEDKRQPVPEHADRDGPTRDF